MPYPAIRPTDLTLDLGSHGVRSGEWNGVWEAPELTGSLSTEPVLTLRYQNIRNADGVRMLADHRRSGSGFYPLFLPPEAVAGVVNADLAAFILNPPGLYWTWAEAPQYSAVKAGRCSVDVKLIAELR